MAEKRKRSQNFTTDDKDKLLILLSEHKDTILNKRTDGTTNEAKLSAWNTLTASFNATGCTYRTKESLMKCWEKLKSDSKTYYCNTRRSTVQTGGGPSIIKTDPIMEKVCSIMGRGCTGIEGVSDSDDPTNSVESLDCTQESLPKVICVGDGQSDQARAQDNIIIEIPENLMENASQEDVIKKTPLWSRRRPVPSHLNERSEAVNKICTSYKDMNKKKEDVEDLKCKLLQEELEGKKKLNELQLQAAEKDLIIKDLEIAIKKAVLTQITGGADKTQNWCGISANTNKN